MKLHSLVALVVGTALALLAFAGAARADTLTEVGFFSDFDANNHYYSDDDPCPNCFVGRDKYIAGVNKFNPVLGTLNSVTIFAEFDSDVDVSVFANAPTDDSLPHAVVFETTATVDAYIGYQFEDTGSSTRDLLVVTSKYTPFVSCMGGAFEEPCEGDQFYWKTEIGSRVVSDFSGFDVNHFVGAGEVTTLLAMILIPEDSTFGFDNVESATAEIDVNMYYVDVRVEYDYTPIPEPVSGWLLACGLVGLGVRRRRH